MKTPFIPKYIPRPYVLLEDGDLTHTGSVYLCTDIVARNIREYNKSNKHLFEFGDREHAEEALKTYLNKQEKGVTFNFSRAVEELKKGNKIRRQCWGEASYIHSDSSKDKAIVSNLRLMYSFTSNEIFAEDWELFDDSVVVGTLNQGDLFSFPGLPGKKYRLLPAYMIDYVKMVRDVPTDRIVLPCIAHEGFNKPDLCYIPSDLKVIKEK